MKFFEVPFYSALNLKLIIEFDNSNIIIKKQ